MDIGTAKPSAQKRREVEHHLIDVVEPSEPFSVGRFVEMADQVIDDLQQAESPIIAAGGTAMYIRGLIEGIFDGPGADALIRERLIGQAGIEGLGKLHERLVQVDPVASERIHPNDQKRIVRALEVFELTGKPISSFQSHFRSGNYRHDWIIFGLRRSKEKASGRINQRVKKMIDQGLVEEVESLLNEPEGLSSQAAQAVGYAEIIEYLQGEMSLDEAVEKIKINTRRLAKRQRTWFRSFEGVNWFDLDEESTAEKTAQMMVDML